MNATDLLSIFYPNISDSERLANALGWTMHAKSDNINNFLLKQEIKRIHRSLNSIEFDFSIDQYGRPCCKNTLTTSFKKIHPSYIEKTKSFTQEKIKLGQFIIGLSESKNYEKMPLDAAFALAQVSNTTKQYKVYLNSNLQPTGVLTWAWVNQDCINRITESDDLSLHPAEWNEGRILWFRDVAVNACSALEIAHDLSGGLFPEISECYVTMHSRKLGRSIPVNFSNSERTQLSDWIHNKI